MSRRRDPSRRRGLGHPPPLELQTTRELVEEVLRTALALEDIIVSLDESLPKGAFPGEDSTHVLMEMVVGSVHPAARAAGECDCRVATALVGAIRERVIDDLHAAAELAEERR
jgi:hypothetical protein